MPSYRRSQCYSRLNPFHWFRNPEKSIASMSCALRKGGKLAILTYPRESPYWDFLQITESKKPFSDYRRLSASQTLPHSDTIRSWLIKEHLKIERFDIEDLTATYEDLDSLENYISGWIHSYLPLSKPLQAQFLKESCFEALNQCKNSKITLP